MQDGVHNRGEQNRVRRYRAFTEVVSCSYLPGLASQARGSIAGRSCLQCGG
jgi:hypothetical protein